MARDRINLVADVLMEWARFTEPNRLNQHAVAGYYAAKVIDALDRAEQEDAEDGEPEPTQGDGLRSLSGGVPEGDVPVSDPFAAERSW